MKKYIPAMIIIAIIVMLPITSSASTPTLNPPPSTLPSITYYSSGVNYSISDSDWATFFTSVIDNHNYVTYSFNTSLQYLIVYDLNYTGMNPYGLQFIAALTGIGSPTLHNMTKAFNITKNEKSQVKGYTNIQALDAGAYPGFPFSKPVVKPLSIQYMYIGIIVAIIAGMVFLYYFFNRKK
ncbi:MAG: hypothetical protein QXZ44_04530 [Ferroplasma sp.]